MQQGVLGASYYREECPQMGSSTGEAAPGCHRSLWSDSRRYHTNATGQNRTSGRPPSGRCFSDRAVGTLGREGPAGVSPRAAV
jgi:hypothetical protein